MKNNKWSQWEDVGVRTDSYGRDWLLQMRTRYTDNKKVFKNRSLDATFGGYILFHDKNVIGKLKQILTIND